MQTRSDLPLPAASPLCWKAFVRDQLERRPLRFAGAPLATPAECFEAAIGSSQRFLRSCRRQPESEGIRPEVRFYRAGALVTTDLADWLPSERDVSAQAYAQRIEDQLSGAGFELVVNELQTSSAPLWFRLREFALPLYAEAGLPGDGADAVLFLRNRPTTSFGVHKDRASVFAFPLVGRRRIVTWEHDAYRGEPFSSRYAPLRAQAHVLEGDVGDVLYWPSTHWHVGESEPGLSMSLNVGFRYRLGPRLPEARRFTHLLECCPSLDAAQRLCSSDELAYEAEIWRMTQHTGYGFQPPPPRTATFSSRAWLRGSSVHPAVVLGAPGRKTVVSANGRAFALDPEEQLPALLELLNSGQRFRAADVGALASPALEDLLRRLYGCWAVETETSE